MRNRVFLPSSLDGCSMRWAAIGFGLGAAAWLAPTLVNLWEHKDPAYLRTAKYYLVPGLIFLVLAGIFAAL